MATLSEVTIPTTNMARATDTVNLDASPLPKLLLWGSVFALAGYALTRWQAVPRGTGPDAIDELAAEARRIERRVAARRGSIRRQHAA